MPVQGSPRHATRFQFSNQVRGGTPRGSAMGVVLGSMLTIPRPSKTQGVSPKLNNAFSLARCCEP
jgi:hypothetical protein